MDGDEFDFLSLLETEVSDPLQAEPGPALDVVAVAESFQAASEPAAIPVVEPAQGPKTFA